MSGTLLTLVVPLRGIMGGDGDVAIFVLFTGSFGGTILNGVHPVEPMSLLLASPLPLIPTAALLPPSLELVDGPVEPLSLNIGSLEALDVEIPSRLDT